MATVKHTNADGLVQHYGPRVSENHLAREPRVSGSVRELVADLAYNQLPTFDEDASGGETPDSFGSMQAFIPAGALIKSATIVSSGAWTGAGTLDVGLYTKAGAAIDADGIDALVDVDVALADANSVIVCDGALVGATVGADDAYLVVAATGAVTAGTAKLVIEFIV